MKVPSSTDCRQARPEGAAAGRRRPAPQAHLPIALAAEFIALVSRDLGWPVKALEAAATHTIDITEFLKAEQIERVDGRAGYALSSRAREILDEGDRLVGYISPR